MNGTAYAGFWDGANWLPNPTTRTDINTITVRAKGAALQADSVKIKFTYGTVVVRTGWPTTVWAPNHLHRWGRADTGGWNPNWWQTDYDYRTMTAWDAVFPDKGDVGINEEWTSALQHSASYPGYNWDLIGDRVPGYAAEHWSDPPSDVHDRLCIEDEVPPFANPLPVPGNGTLVDWQGQRFRMGSETPGVGVIVKSHTVRGYLGYGRHDPD